MRVRVLFTMSALVELMGLGSRRGLWAAREDMVRLELRRRGVVRSSGRRRELVWPGRGPLGGETGSLMLTRPRLHGWLEDV